MAGRGPAGAPAAPPLRLSGTPSSLRTALSTPAGQPAQAVPVEMKSPSGDAVAFRSATLVGGQVKLRLDPATPPGRYAGAIDLNGATQPIELDVLDSVALRLRPASPVVDLAVGREQRLNVAVENRGNVALTIDVTGDYPLGEELPLLREEPAPQDGDGMRRLVDLLSRAGGMGRGRPLREVGKVALAMPDGAFRLEPGATRIVSVAATFPEDLSATARYRAFIPLFSEDLELIAVTAAKRAPRARATVPRKRGA